ncbi:MAG: type IV pilus assembly protein PilQ, partial [Cellvibrionaceae bacterium]
MESSAAIKKAITKLLFFRAFLGAVLLMGLIPSAIAANRLMDVKYHSMVDHQLELELIFESSIVSPSVDLSADPAEIMLNFSDTISNLNKSKIPINAVGVIELTTQQQGGDLQIIVAMSNVKPYQGKIVGNSYRLTINDDVSGPVEANNPFVNGISSIDFRRNKTGGGEILFNLSNRSVAANVEQVGSKLEIKLYNTDIGNDLLYVMDVQDFATPVNSFETFKDDLTARILVDVDGNYDYNYRQDGNVFKVSVDKVERVSVAKEAKKYNGRSLSLNFQNISVRTVLQI